MRTPQDGCQRSSWYDVKLIQIWEQVRRKSKHVKGGCDCGSMNDDGVLPTFLFNSKRPLGVSNMIDGALNGYSTHRVSESLYRDMGVTDQVGVRCGHDTIHPQIRYRLVHESYSASPKCTPEPN